MVLLVVVPVAAAAAQTPAGAVLTGTVVDARTGAPLEKILVSIDGGPSTETAADGTFSFRGLPPGRVRLNVSAVGYGLVQRTLDLSAGDLLDIRIPLSEGSAAYTENVTVTADRFARPEAAVPAEQALGSAELQNLRGVLADDVMRAVQVLPGVATGDDFRSEFAVRGSDFSHMNLTIDGFATPYVLHMVRAVEERANTGSVSMINSDVLEGVTLLSGGYPQRTGNRTGAEVAFTMREGSRDRAGMRLAVSGTNAAIVGEGPIGQAKKGSWLVSGRKSYLDLIIDRLREEGLSFGFSDVQAKLRYDISPRQSASLTFIAGRSTLEEEPNGEGDDPFVGHNGSAVLITSWRRAFQQSVLTVRGLAATNTFDNHTRRGVSLEDGSSRQLAVRADLSVNVRPSVQLESGTLVEYADEAQTRFRRITSVTSAPTNDYHADSLRPGAYALAIIRFGDRVLISPGARVDGWQLTDQFTASPWMQSQITIRPGLVLRGAAGLYQQFPGFEAVVGTFAGEGLRPERSIQTDVGLEHRLSPSMRVQATLYNREDGRVIRRPEADTRLVDGRVVRGSVTAPYGNRLEGYARGIEFLVQRTAPRGLSGWFSYSYGRNRYHDVATGESYWADLDQRHTLNAYGFYRFSHKFSVSAKYRTGTNFPVPGYYAQSGTRYFLSEERNVLRLPSYARLDLRANRTFDWSRSRLTLFAEVLNVLNRANVRFNPPRVSPSTREVTRLFESLVPVVPSAGLLLEF